MATNNPIAPAPPVGLPLLEVINTPFRGWVNIAPGATRVTFFDRPVGTTDAAAPTGQLTERETSFLTASSFPTPTQNTLYSFNQRFNLNAAYADLTDFYRRAFFSFKLGPKFYVLVPTLYIPGGNQVIARVTAAAENVNNGVESQTLAFDVTVPEQVVTADGRCIDAPERVPMFIPSQQLLQGVEDIYGGYGGTADLQQEISGNSFLRREVS